MNRQFLSMQAKIMAKTLLALLPAGKFSGKIKQNGSKTCPSGKMR